MQIREDLVRVFGDTVRMIEAKHGRHNGNLLPIRNRLMARWRIQGQSRGIVIEVHEPDHYEIRGWGYDRIVYNTRFQMRAEIGAEQVRTYLDLTATVMGLIE